MEGKKALGAITEKLKGAKYPLIVLLAGLVLLLLPTGKSGDGASPPDSGEAAQTVAAQTGTDLEAELEEMLSLVDGAGEVRILLAPSSDGERVLARDYASSGETGDSETRSESTETAVIVQRSGGGSETVEVSYVYPRWRGAVVAAQGADDPRVKLELLEAVKAATGLSGDAIKIVKMK